MILTCQWVHSNPGTHLLEVVTKFGVLSDLVLVFRCELFKVFFKRVQLSGYLYIHHYTLSRDTWHYLNFNKNNIREIFVNQQYWSL